MDVLINDKVIWRNSPWIVEGMEVQGSTLTAFLQPLTGKVSSSVAMVPVWELKHLGDTPKVHVRDVVSWHGKHWEILRLGRRSGYAIANIACLDVPKGVRYVEVVKLSSLSRIS